MDNVDVLLEAIDGRTSRVSVVSDQRAGILLLRWLGPVRWCLNWLDLRPAIERFSILVEAGKQPEPVADSTAPAPSARTAQPRPRMLIAPLLARVRAAASRRPQAAPQ